MPRTVGPFFLNGWRKVVGRKRLYSYCSRFTLCRVCRIPLRPVRKRRTSLETRLALKPGRKPSRQPQRAGRVLLWPEGATLAQALQWWAKVWGEMQAVKAARNPRRVRANLRTRRQILEGQAAGPSPVAAKLPPVFAACSAAGSFFRDGKHGDPAPRGTRDNPPGATQNV